LADERLKNLFDAMQGLPAKYGTNDVLDLIKIHMPEKVDEMERVFSNPELRVTKPKNLEQLGLLVGTPGDRAKLNLHRTMDLARVINKGEALGGDARFPSLRHFRELYARARSGNLLGFGGMALTPALLAYDAVSQPGNVFANAGEGTMRLLANRLGGLSETGEAPSDIGSGSVKERSESFRTKLQAGQEQAEADLASRSASPAAIERRRRLQEVFGQRNRLTNG